MIYSLKQLNKKKSVDEISKNESIVDCNLIRKQLLLCVNQQKSCIKWKDKFKHECIFKNITI